MSSDMHGGAIGILGGSGLYELAGLLNAREVPVDTPFGSPSDPPLVGHWAGRTVIFLPRHGRGHRLLPSEIPNRANVHALKQLGASWVISVSAVGSLRESIRPGDLVIIDQLIDRTYKRENTFFGEGCVGHVSFADPVCAHLAAHLGDAAQAVGYRLSDAETTLIPGTRRIHRGGAYVCMEGPQFSTRAESMLHRAWDASVIGMTAAPEAKLCREAEMCFSVMALATDYDCWHPEESSVSATAVVEVLRQNIAGARSVLERALAQWPAAPTDLWTCGCGTAAQNAIMTARNAIPTATKDKLRRLFGAYLDEPQS